MFGSSEMHEMFARSLVQRTVDVFKKTVKSSCHRGLVHLTSAVALSSAFRFGLNSYFPGIKPDVAIECHD